MQDVSASAAQPPTVPAVQAHAEGSASVMPSDAIGGTDTQPQGEGVNPPVAPRGANDVVPKPDCIKQLTETEETGVTEAPNAGRPATALGWKPQPMKRKPSSFAKAFSRQASKPSQVTTDSTSLIPTEAQAWCSFKYVPASLRLDLILSLIDRTMRVST